MTMQPIFTNYTTGRGLYAVWKHPAKGIFNWTTMLWETFNSLNWSHYALNLSDPDNMGAYIVMPPDVVLDVIPIDFIYERQFSGSPLTLQPPAYGDLAVGSGNSQGVNLLALNSVVAGAVQMALSALTMIPGAAIAGTLTTTQMTTNLTVALTGAFVGRSILWTSGQLAGSGARILGYDGTTKKLAFSAVPVAPAAADAFIIV